MDSAKTVSNSEDKESIPLLVDRHCAMVYANSVWLLLSVTPWLRHAHVQRLSIGDQEAREGND